MKNYRSEGKSVTVVAPAAVASGDFVVVGSLYGFAAHSAAVGEDVVITRRGAFMATKGTGTAIAQGEPLEFAGGVFAAVDSGTHVATALTSAASDATSVNVVLV
ncbi:MAG: DUF2190 family protein [Pseudomonadota bacterium]